MHLEFAERRIEPACQVSPREIARFQENDCGARFGSGNLERIGVCRRVCLILRSRSKKIRHQPRCFSGRFGLDARHGKVRYPTLSARHAKHVVGHCQPFLVVR